MLVYLSGLISVFLIIYTIYISNYNKNILKQNERKINFLMMQQQRGEFLGGIWEGILSEFSKNLR